MHWVVQENVKDEATYHEFIQALTDLNVAHTLVKVVPFSHEVIPDVNLPGQGQVMVWGSTMLDLIAKNKDWKPGTFLNDNFDQRIWTSKYSTCETCAGTGVESSGVCYCGQSMETHSLYDNHCCTEMTRECESCHGKSESYMLNADAEVYAFGHLPQFVEQRFIRPVHDMKVFSGMVVNSAELEEWKETIQRYSDGYITLRPETPVIIARVKDIEMEWRFFVVSGRVVTGSRYRQWGLSDHRRIEANSEPWKFAQKMVDLWQPADAFVLDLAVVNKDPAYKVIEVNCINSSGFYACDMRKVIEAIESM